MGEQSSEETDRTTEKDRRAEEARERVQGTEMHCQ